MNPLKTTPKTTLVQSLEEIQEDNKMVEAVAVIENYINYINYVNCINSSVAVPSGVLRGDSENYLTMYPEKPTLIKIDTTKLQ